MQALNSACKTDLAGFTDWIFFLPCNLMKQISPGTEALSANKIISMETLGRQDLGIDVLI